MGKKYLVTGLMIFLGAFVASSVYGQGAGDVLRYSLQYPSYDPVSLVMPGVANATGFGAYQENPAVMALFDQSYFSGGLSGRFVNEDGTYLGNTSSFNDSQVNISNVGFVYNLPTSRGKLTIGAGYSQTHDFNRAFSGSAVNDLSTITDFYASPLASDFLNTAAYNAFAINDRPSGGSVSVFRFGANQFSNINQRFETTERGKMGEFSAFVATEFLKDLIVGASLGIITGNYKYERRFLEVDGQGNYNGAVLDTDEDGRANTNVDQILVEDIIDASFAGFSARLGLLYEITPHFNIGASYQFKNTLNVNDKSDTYITTTMDNNETFSDEDLREVEYQIVRPARLKVGAAAKNISGFTLSASVEYVDHSDGRIYFDGVQEDHFEDQENSYIRSNYEEVINLRVGLAYKINEYVTPRIGYGYYPDPLGGFEEGSGLNANRQFYSAGFSAQLSARTQLNMGVQLAKWDDSKAVYSTPEVTETIVEHVNHWNIMAGLRMYF